MFYIKDASNTVQSTSNKFKNNYIASKGGAFSLYNTQFTDISSEYEGLSALYGGAIYCDFCTLSLNQIKFKLLRAYEGGTIYVT